MNGADFKPSAEALTAQGQDLLAALREGPKSTAQLRAILGQSSSPAARVLDARKAGHRIVTQREGRQALYSLLPGDGSAA